MRGQREVRRVENLVALVRAGARLECGQLIERAADPGRRVWCIMTEHHGYGTSTHTASELVRLVSDRLGRLFVERNSDYRGVYHLAGTCSERIEIQPNPIPGDDEDDLYAPEHPSVHVLLFTTTPAPDPALQARLDSIDGLTHLDSETA